MWIVIHFTVDRFHKGPVSPRTFQENILEQNKTYVDKHTVTYASFCVKTYQIYIIISTELITFYGTSTRTSCIPRVLQSNEMSRKTAPGLSQGIKFTPTTANPNHCTISPPSNIGIFKYSNHINISPYHDFAISPFMPEKNWFTIGPFHHFRYLTGMTN